MQCPICHKEMSERTTSDIGYCRVDYSTVAICRNHTPVLEIFHDRTVFRDDREDTSNIRILLEHWDITDRHNEQFVNELMELLRKEYLRQLNDEEGRVTSDE